MVDHSFISFLQMEFFPETIRGAHNQITWSERVRLSLQFVARHPEDLRRIGLVSCDYKSILVNARIFGEFLGVNPNTVNRNFTRHGFMIDAKCDVTQELRIHAPKLARMLRSWCKLVSKFGRFNFTSSAEDVDRMPTYARNFRRGLMQTDDAQSKAGSEQLNLQWYSDFDFGGDHSNWLWSSRDWEILESFLGDLRRDILRDPFP
jgi:hypothetical protein